MKHPNGHFKKKPCRSCGEPFQPEAPSHLYCGEDGKIRGFDHAYYKRTYGASVADIERMRADQGNSCYLCGSAGFLMREHHRRPLVVDHDHDTGRVRKLLCHNCNRALGLFSDNPDLMRKAAAYVEAHKEGATTIP